MVEIQREDAQLKLLKTTHESNDTLEDVVCNSTGHWTILQLVVI